MRHNPIDQVYAEIVAARERKVTLIIEAIKNLRHRSEGSAGSARCSLYGLAHE